MKITSSSSKIAITNQRKISRIEKNKINGKKIKKNEKNVEKVSPILISWNHKRKKNGKNIEIGWGSKM